MTRVVPIATLLVLAQALFFLNKDGGTYVPGFDDARLNRSSLLDSTRAVPPFACTPAEWDAVMTCVRGQFAPFNATVTDADPGNVPHVECVIGGSPSDVGQPSTTSGVAPYS